MFLAWNSGLACPMMSIAGCPSSSGRPSSFPPLLCLLPGSSMSRSHTGGKIQAMMSCASLRAQAVWKRETTS